MEEILQIVNDGGVIALLILIFIGGIRKFWVFGWIYQELIEEKDEWKALALKGADLAETIAKAKDKHHG